MNTEGGFKLRKEMAKDYCKVISASSLDVFACPLCGKTFSQLSYLRIHEDMHMDGKQKFYCKFCNKAFFHSTALQAHLPVHGNVLPRFKCPYCDKVYLSGSSRNHHVRFVHFPTVHKCPQCGAEYTRKYVLNRHIANVHLGLARKRPDEKLNCTQCGRTVYGHAKMKIHLITCVDGVQLAYQCRWCPLRFATAKQLEAHFVEKHPNN